MIDILTWYLWKVHNPHPVLYTEHRQVTGIVSDTFKYMYKHVYDNSCVCFSSLMCLGNIRSRSVKQTVSPDSASLTLSVYQSPTQSLHVCLPYMLSQLCLCISRLLRVYMCVCHICCHSSVCVSVDYSKFTCVSAIYATTISVHILYCSYGPPPTLIVGAH